MCMIERHNLQIEKHGAVTASWTAWAHSPKSRSFRSGPNNVFYEVYSAGDV
jgi:hypothetical protein